MQERIASARDGAELGSALYDGEKAITYYTGLQKQALERIVRIVSDGEKKKAESYVSNYIGDIDAFGKMQVNRFREEVKAAAKERSISVVNYKAAKGEWEREAATIIPSRSIIGPLTYDGVPAEEFMGSPRWWSARNWAAASYWWCDGKRNVNEIQELVELEAGVPVRDFDLIDYFKFLEKYDMVEFVK